MNIVLVGLSASGKSTLFTSFTGTVAPEGGHHRGAVGVVNVPDRRLDALSEVCRPEKTVYANVNFIDSAPLETPVKQDRIALFDTMKTASAMVCVLGAYRTSSAGELVSELKKVRLELLISDLDLIAKRKERLEREIQISAQKAQKQKEMDMLERIEPLLEAEKFLYGMTFDREEEAHLNNFSLLSLKPFCYVINCHENTTPSAVKALEEEVKGHLATWDDPSPVIALNGQLESEIALMEPGDREKYLQEFGIAEHGRYRVIRAAYERLSLITFFTIGEDECRAWKVRRGGTALDAAGTIHSDLARGFIRAEVIEHDQFLHFGSLQEARKAGKLRLEGKTYEVRDGEIVHIMFNV
ncbi:MAG: DUF933 domain-containing protein [Candidatus Eremiobacteraeota bacterium]|nr:DUF933 domain-containing protein [Candidatus Eremiobacteraeota bacterium]